jgi:hypothetical protein
LRLDSSGTLALIYSDENTEAICRVFDAIAGNAGSFPDFTDGLITLCFRVATGPSRCNQPQQSFARWQAQFRGFPAVISSDDTNLIMAGNL